MPTRFQKRGADALAVAVDLARALTPGATVVASNARGALGVVARDSTGADVSLTLLEGAPSILSGTRVAFWLLGGVPGPNYTITVTGPTSDGELIVEPVELEVLA